MVTPFVGVWIETLHHQGKRLGRSVTPFVGVWIETLLIIGGITRPFASHPSWVCGLKLVVAIHPHDEVSHTLRGCVD